MRLVIHTYIQDRKSTETQDGAWTIKHYERNNTLFAGTQVGPDFIQCKNNNGFELELSAAGNTVELYVKMDNEGALAANVVEQIPSNVQSFTMANQIPQAQQADHSGFALTRRGNGYVLYHVNKEKNTVTQVLPPTENKYNFESSCMMAAIQLDSNPACFSDDVLGPLFSSFDLNNYADLNKTLSSVFVIDQGRGKNSVFMWKPQKNEPYGEMLALLKVIRKEMNMPSSIVRQLENLVQTSRTELNMIRTRIMSLSKSERLVEFWKVQEDLATDPSLRSVYTNLKNYFSAHNRDIVEQMELASREYNKKMEACMNGKTYTPPHAIAEILLQIEVEAEREKEKKQVANNQLNNLSAIPYFNTPPYDQYMGRQRVTFKKQATVYTLRANNEPFPLTSLCNYSASIVRDTHFTTLENMEDMMRVESQDLGAGFTLNHLRLPFENAAPDSIEAVVLSGLSGMDVSLSRIGHEFLLRIVFENVPCTTIKNIQKMARNLNCTEIGLKFVVSNLKPTYSYPARSYESVGVETAVCRYLNTHKALRQFIEGLSEACYFPKEMQKECLDMIDKTIAKLNDELEAQSKHDSLYW